MIIAYMLIRLCRKSMPPDEPGALLFLCRRLWGVIFLLVRRNLWVVVIGHAVMDTTVFVLVFLGLHRLLLPG